MDSCRCHSTGNCSELCGERGKRERERERERQRERTFYYVYQSNHLSQKKNLHEVINTM